jgi:hypothetical protein
MFFVATVAATREREQSMKIEFNGRQNAPTSPGKGSLARMVAGFLLGAFCGAVIVLVAASGPIGRIQRQRDALVADQEHSTKLIHDLSAAVNTAADHADRCEALRAADAVWQATVAKNNGPALAKPADASDQLRLLNVLRPGLGDLAAKLYEAKHAAAAQALAKANAECPAGSTLQTGPWQGLKCVAVDPQ